MKNLAILWKKYSFIILLAFIIGGLFDLRIGLIAILCMVGPIVVSFFRGRFWCGNICPRGSFYDSVVSKISGKRSTPKFLRSKLFRFLVTALMLTVFITGVISSHGDLYKIGFVIYRLIVVTTIIGLALALFFNERTWCSFCPMGSIAAVVSRFKNKKNSSRLLSVNNSCVNCKLCVKVCPMDVTPNTCKGSVITHHDCIQCGRCIKKCPKKSIQ